MRDALTRHHLGSLLVVIAGFVLVTALLTEPLIYRGASAGPINSGDGQLSLWNVAWVARALVRDPLHVYDANIFAPHPATLAYSEANLPAGALGLPAWWIWRNPYLAYNTSAFLSIVLAGLATFALVRSITSSRLAATVAAILFAFAPFVVVRYAHIQLLMTAGLPLTLLAQQRFADRPGAGRAVALALAIVLAGLGCGYYGIFAAITTGLGFIYYGVVRRSWRDVRYLALVALVAAVAAAAIVPFFLPYLGLMRQAEPFRTLADARQYSADWPSYLASTTHIDRALLGSIVSFDRARIPERILFPGLVTCLLASAALALALRGTEDSGGRTEDSGVRIGGSVRLSQREREAAGYYGLLGILAGWLSFGPDAGLYLLAYRTVPAWSLLRAPARFGVLVALALVALAGIGLAAFLRRTRRPVLVASLVGLVAVVELAAIPWDLRDALPVPAAYRVLAQLPDGAVAEFPFFFRETDFHRHSIYMLYSTVHWHPLVNGYSDYIPEDFRQLVVPVSSFPAREALQILRAHGARYAVFHLDLYDHRSREKLLERIERYREYIRPIVRQDDVWLYEIVKWTG